jgi:hypothetical protein
MQEVIDQWEGGLRATGGALVASKGYWYLLDFKWCTAKSNYHFIHNFPDDIHIRDADNSRVVLTRLKLSDTQETLGIMITMDGNCNAKIQHLLRKKADVFADQLRTDFIHKNDAWLVHTHCHHHGDSGIPHAGNNNL